MYSFSSFIETQFNTSIVQGLCLQSLADLTPLATTTTGSYWPFTQASCPSHRPLALHTGNRRQLLALHTSHRQIFALHTGRPTSDLASSTATATHRARGAQPSLLSAASPPPGCCFRLLGSAFSAITSSLLVFIRWGLSPRCRHVTPRHLIQYTRQLVHVVRC